MVERSGWRLSAVALLVVMSLCADSPGEVPLLPTSSVEPLLPDSAAGRALEAWLNALNSGEQSRMEAYFGKYHPLATLDDLLQLRKETGGFDLLGIQKTEPLRIQFIVRGKTNRSTARASIEIEKTAGTPIITLHWLPRTPHVRLDKALRAKVIDTAIAQLNQNYVFADVARKMAAAVRARQKHGDYDSITDGDRFAAMLTADFRAISRDKHLSVLFGFHDAPPPLFDGPGNPQHSWKTEHWNCDFSRVEILQQNIGYVKLDTFSDTNLCEPTATAAMGFVANADALIIDLRDNRGGRADMVALLSSYLFEGVMSLGDVRDRGGTIYEHRTLPNVSGKGLADKPVFVLTSSRTISAAEAFCYALKNLRRATIVGERTAGAAHTVSFVSIDEHFTIIVPVGEAIDPISKTNWEGVGVEPDVEVPAADALSTAQKLAAERLSLSSRVSSSKGK